MTVSALETKKGEREKKVERGIGGSGKASHKVQRGAEIKMSIWVGERDFQSRGNSGDEGP